METKVFYLITHGEIFQQVPDSNLTSVGKNNVLNIKQYLPKKLGSVVSGTGKRHLETAQILNLEINSYSELIETGTLTTQILEKSICILPRGDLIPMERYFKDLAYQKRYLKEMILSLPNSSIIIGGEITALKLDLLFVPLASISTLQYTADNNFRIIENVPI